MDQKSNPNLESEFQIRKLQALPLKLLVVPIKANRACSRVIHLLIPMVAEMRHLPVKEHQAVKHKYPLNDSAGAQNAIPANKNTPNC